MPKSYEKIATKNHLVADVAVAIAVARQAHRFRACSIPAKKRTIFYMPTVYMHTAPWINYFHPFHPFILLGIDWSEGQKAKNAFPKVTY
jgi:hypothetical protein